jgi:hypothetical protein
MRRTIVAAAAAIILAVPAAAESRAAYPLAGLSAERCAESFTIREFRRYASRVYRRERVSQRARQRMVQMRRCSPTQRRSRWMRRWQARYAAERAARQEGAENWCSPNPHPAGADCWVIPFWCVDAETRGYTGRAKWRALNHEGSGARGPYQLYKKPDPWPVRTRAQAMVHHRIARALYATRGLQPWSACS